MERIKVLITGADGFVGRALGVYLAGKGLVVYRAIRQTGDPTIKSDLRVVGDIDATTDWSAALQGVDAVIHLAARVHVMADQASDPLADFRKVNTAGTINLARQAAGVGVRRFVYLSTVKVNGEKTGVSDGGNGRRFSEADPPCPSDHYAISKWEAEQGLAQISADTAMELVIVRPPLVYGPGVRANFLSLMRWIDLGVPLPLGRIDNRRSLVSLENLVDFLFNCLVKPAAAGETFMVADGEDLSTPELIRRIAGLIGRPARLVPVPETLLRLGGRLLGRSAEIERLCGSLQIEIGKAKHLLNWEPPLSMDEGLRRTVNWYLKGTA
ncbi:MAG: SDR family oxidoreductase [Proteobacteria bacterium]|nr:SDR family oxidoreductase [Pseudomonadota bacterium]MBU1715150.1 SDR family oxidoreductase [Pseudomonadota bacterium]